MAADDPSIADDVRLYRRVHPDQLIWDDNEARLRPTSNAFKDPTLSVNLSDDMEHHGFDVEWTLRIDPLHHSASVSVGEARERSQEVWRDPLVAHPRYGTDPTHGIVEGKKKGAKASGLAKAAEVEVVRGTSLSAETLEAIEMFYR